MRATSEYPKVAYIISQFPETNETFILREILALVQQGLPLSIFSLKRCKDTIIHAEAKPLMDRLTVYPPSLLSPELWKAFAGFALLRPLRFLGILITLIVDNFRHPVYLLKSLYGLFISLYFARLIRDRGIAHVHAHWATIPGISAWVISKVLRQPFSLTAHAWDIYLNPGNLRRLMKAAQFVVTCTRSNRDYLVQTCGQNLSGKIHVIYHGLDTRQFQGRRRRRRRRIFSILGVGRMVPQKGFQYLIEACSILQERRIPFQCMLVGGGPEASRLKKLIERFQLEDQVYLVGPVDQRTIFALMQGADVFVVPSVIAPNGDRDGIPNVLLEAMAWGIPVIATAVSGIPEVVKHQQTGILIRGKDPQALAEALEDLYGHPRLARRLGQNGRQFIYKHFDIIKNTQDLLNLFQNEAKNQNYPNH